MSRAKAPVDAGNDAERIAAFLRSLAAQAEGDPTFAATLQKALEESGLLAAPKASKAPRGVKRATVVAATGQSVAEATLDPFAVYRDRGEDALRDVLAAQDIAALRGMIRAHRLDPARISARWTASDRLVALIVQQVQARANIGKAFARV